MLLITPRNYLDEGALVSEFIIVMFKKKAKKESTVLKLDEPEEQQPEREEGSVNVPSGQVEGASVTEQHGKEGQSSSKNGN